jgi:hypothetical protein
MWASDKGLCRPTDLAVSRGNPSKAFSYRSRSVCLRREATPTKGLVGWRSRRSLILSG